MEEPGIGHLDIVRYRYNTHSERRGGSVFYLSTVKGVEAFVRWLGNWKSLAFFSYAKVSRDYATMSWKSILDVLKVVDAQPLERLHGGASADPVCPVCSSVFPLSVCTKGTSKSVLGASVKQFCDDCYVNKRADCIVFADMCANNV